LKTEVSGLEYRIRGGNDGGRGIGGKILSILIRTCRHAGEEAVAEKLR
jgi:hypothetical protein